MAKFFTPGIFENLVFSKNTGINDKGTLELHLTTVQPEGADNDLWDSDDIGEIVSGKFLVFPPMMFNTPKGSTTKIPKTAAEIGVDLRTLRKLLLEYAMLLGTEAKASEAFGGKEAFRGIGLAEDQIVGALTRLNDEKFCKKVYVNMVTKFVTYMKSIENFDSIAFRHKFFRKNAKEGFAVLPSSTKPYPFESMLVPKEASKIGWTKWELDNKKNDASPSTKDAAKKVEQADSLFAAESPGEVTKKPAAQGVDSLI